jgi:hypothetical protein
MLDMRVIFADISVGLRDLSSVEPEGSAMAAIDPCLIRSTSSCGDLLVRLGMPVLDDYLRFVQARARPNTVLAAAFDLVVFF